MGLEIYTLMLGETVDDESTLTYVENPGKMRKTAYYSFYIKGAETPIIVDTFIRDPSKPNWGNPVELKPEWDYKRQLVNVGVDPKDVGIVILTHLHFDHCGNNHLFPNAKIYVQRDELASAATLNDPRSLQLFDKRDIADLIERDKNRVVMIDGDTEIVRGVKCVRTGGHTAGSQAVYVQTDQGLAILTGDACYVYDNLEKRIPTGIFFRYDECISAIDRFRREGRFIIVNHDLEVLKRYRKVPP